MENDLVLERRKVFLEIRKIDRQIKFIESVKNPIDKNWNDNMINRLLRDKEPLIARISELMPKENRDNIEGYLKAMENNCNEDNECDGAS